MTILSELQAVAYKPNCKLCNYLDGCDEQLASEWHEALALPVSSVGNSAVQAVLRRRGVDVEETSVRRHRRNHSG